MAIVTALLIKHYDGYALLIRIVRPVVMEILLGFFANKVGETLPVNIVSTVIYCTYPCSVFSRLIVTADGTRFSGISLEYVRFIVVKAADIPVILRQNPGDILSESRLYNHKI